MEVEVDRGVRQVREVVDAVAELEGQLEPPAGAEDSGRLGEDTGEVRIGDVDDRIPRHEPGEGRVRMRKSGHRPDVEVELRVDPGRVRPWRGRGRGRAGTGRGRRGKR